MEGPDNWWESWLTTLAPYGVLMRAFVDGRVSAEEFELLFLRLYKQDATDWPPDVFDALDGLFGAVDDYCADPKLRAKTDGIGEMELRDRAIATYEQLRAISDR